LPDPPYATAFSWEESPAHKDSGFEVAKDEKIFSKVNEATLVCQLLEEVVE
jgi:hypothetical protein